MKAALQRMTHLLVVSAGIALICGCGGDSNPDTYSVTGKVTLDGTPVEGALVSFASEGGSRPATGITDASGAYSLTTFAQGDGAVPGSYKVTITKYEDSGDDAAAAGGVDTSGGSDMGADDEYPDDYDPDAPEVTGDEEAKNLLPTKYSATSAAGYPADEMTVEVTTSALTKDFALTSN